MTSRGRFSCLVLLATACGLSLPEVASDSIPGQDGGGLVHPNSDAGPVTLDDSGNVVLHDGGVVPITDAGTPVDSSVVPVADTAPPLSDAGIRRIASFNTQTTKDTFDSREDLSGAVTSIVTSPTYDPAFATRSTTTGSDDRARGIFDETHVEGDEFTFGAAYYLPAAFKANLSQHVQIARSDNDPLSGQTNDSMTVAAEYTSDGKLHVVFRDRAQYNQPVELVTPFNVPNDTWFWLQIHQHLGCGNGAAAFTRVYVNGAMMGSSTIQNCAKNISVKAFRFGLVFIVNGGGGDTQKKPLELYMDRATLSDTPVPPLP